MDTKINNRHRAIMEALVYEGLTAREISARFSISESHLSILRNSALWKIEELALKAESLVEYKSKLAALVPKAIEALNDIIVPSVLLDEGTNREKLVFNDPKNRLAAAKEILNIGGFNTNINIATIKIDDKSTLLDSLEKIRAEKDSIIKELGLA